MFCTLDTNKKMTFMRWYTNPTTYTKDRYIFDQLLSPVSVKDWQGGLLI